MLKPVANTDLGSPTNTYGNLYMSGNISLNGTSLNSTNAITPRIASIAYVGDDTAANPAGGQTITLNGSGFVSGAAVYVGGTVATPVTVVSSTQITFIAPAKTTGSYSLNVVNTDGAAATFIPGMQYSGVPSWSTAAGSLGAVSQATSVNFTVVATSDSTVTYSVTSGSLPSGVSLNSNTGAITGTAPSVGSNTTYSFTIRATDSENQDTDRNFSMTVNAMSAPSTVEYLVVAGGGSGGGTDGGGGGGAGGYRTATGFAVSSGTPITVTVGAGGIQRIGSGIGNKGGDSVFGTITSTGGGAGGAAQGTGGSGGSGGGGGSASSTSTPEGAGAGNTPTTTPSQGNNGGGGLNAPGYGAGGGGGGAGGAGANATPGSSAGIGAGGAGVSSSISGTAVTYAAGARGGWQGGDSLPSPGTANTGNGGIGGSSGVNGAAGGSGIVIIRYADTFSAASATTGSPTITVAGGYRVYKFTSSGSITF